MTEAVSETIAAVATPAGRGGIGIVRVSGPRAGAIARALLGRLPEPRRAEHRPFRAADGSVLDRGIALYFPAPRSYTGEDSLELQGHGGPVVLDMVLERVLALGARLARPGEFTERAFLNERLDLAQAEAVADLIGSASRAAARSALRSLEGEFSERVRALGEHLTELRMYVESAIDFPEEEIDFLSEGRVGERLAALLEEITAVAGAAEQGRLLCEGMTAVIAGRPNAGKSSLLNRLAAREAAIVTEIPGTTRDLLREQIAIDGLPLHVIDTAGLRESADPIERLGVARARAAIGEADRVLLVVDDSAGDDGGDAQRLVADGVAPERITRVYNKIDLTGRASALMTDAAGVTAIALSAKTGAGIDLLRSHLKECMGYRGGEGAFSARRRHLDALRRAAAALAEGGEQFAARRAGELLAEDLRAAQRALGEITGEVTSEDLLERIFATFCIGK